MNIGETLYSLEKLIEWKPLSVLFPWPPPPSSLYSLEKLIEWKLVRCSRVVVIIVVVLSLLAREIN